MDKESSRGIGMRLLAPRLNNRNLIFSAPPNQHWPRPRPLLENQPWKEHCSETLLRSSPILKTAADYTYTHIHTKTITDTNTYTHLPTPDPSPPSLWTTSLTSGSVTSAGKWLHVWMADCQSWITSPVAKSCVYGVLCAFVAEVFFLFSHCTPRSIVWGLFFSPYIPLVCCIFLQFPVFLSCLPHCHICMLCMDRLMANFAGTCD